MLSRARAPNLPLEWCALNPTRVSSIGFAVACLSGVALTADAAVLTRHPYPQSPKTDRVTLMWRTATPAAQTIEYGIGGFTHSYIEPVAVTAHEVTLTGLQPGREYVYQLREGATVVTDSQLEYRFRTDAGRSDTVYSFFVTGDVGEDSPDIARQHRSEEHTSELQSLRHL